MLLMFKDIKVLCIDDKFRVVEIFNDKYLRYSALSALLDDVKYTSDVIRDWLLFRINPNIFLEKSWSSRYIKYSGNVDDTFIKQFINLTRAVSVLDCFWIKLDDDNLSWSSMNPLYVYYTSSMINVTLLGNTSIYLNEDCLRPVFTLLGNTPKTIVTIGNVINIVKSRIDEIDNVRNDCVASIILDSLNVPHVKSTPLFFNGKDYIKYKLFVDDRLSYIPAVNVLQSFDYDIDEYLSFIEKTCITEFSNMIAIDYLLQNVCRNECSYGFMIDNNTFDIVELSPLHNFDYAFSTELTKYCRETKYIFEDLSRYIKQSNIKLISEFDMDNINFNETEFSAFMRRLEYIGVK